jgi:hypothetical protein
MNTTTPKSVPLLVERLRQAPTAAWPDGWENDAAVIAAHQFLANECLATMPASPPLGNGRGIVICGGGHRLFSNAWVCVRMLRHVGCSLPIQLWYLGESELDETMRRLVQPFGVECIDGEAVAKLFPARILHGWELKPYAILYAPFREVLLLDADNVPIVDPTFLLDSPEYQKSGAVFWPDYGRLGPDRSIWKICDVRYQDEPEFESGQIVVDKGKCWPALRLALHYNEHSDFYYRHVHGDKETFHLAFRRLQTPFAMPRRGIHSLDATMCQHDFQGRRVFQHRNMDKWRLDGGNRRIGDFQHEDLCRGFLAELRERWCGKVLWNPVPTPGENWFLQELSGRYRYERVGHDQRELELLTNRTIGHGAAGQEQSWTCLLVGGQPSLVLFGEEQPTCRLTADTSSWIGRWFRHERMAVRLERKAMLRASKTDTRE